MYNANSIERKIVSSDGGTFNAERETRPPLRVTKYQIKMNIIK